MRKKPVFVWLLMLFGLASAAFLALPRQIPNSPVVVRTDLKELEKLSLPKPVKRAGSVAREKKMLQEEAWLESAGIEIPPKTRLKSSSCEVKEGLRQSVAKLESELTPLELQIFYTDLFVKDWIIARDNLTAGVGWNGVFMQIEGKEKRLAVFASVSSISSFSSLVNIAIYCVEEE